MLDLTPGQGELCRAAVEKRIPYLGITMTSLHGDRLREQLTQWLQKQSPALFNTFFGCYICYYHYYGFICSYHTSVNNIVALLVFSRFFLLDPNLPNLKFYQAFLRMTTEGSSFYSPEWVPAGEKKRKNEGEDGNDESGKKPKPKTEAKPKPQNKHKQPKQKVIVDSDDDSKSE